MMKTRTLITTSLAALLIAGCGSSDDDLATFGDETPIEREQLVAIAGGQVLVVGYLFALGWEQSSQAGCPARAEEGLVITLTANGCVDEQGQTLDGTAVLDNVQLDLFGEGSPDPTKETRIEIDMTMASAEGGNLEIEGSLRFDPENDESFAGEFDFALSGTGTDPETNEVIETSITHSGITNCAGDRENRLCSYEDSRAALGDLGSFDVEGTYSGGGIVKLKGTNEMSVNLDADENGCVAIEIDGQADGTVCN